MIDNFDHLVERCSARRRRHMIHRSFLIVGSILLVIAVIAGYMEWFSTAAVVPKPVTNPVMSSPTPQHTVELNTTMPRSDSNAAKTTLPKKAIVPAPRSAAPAATNTPPVPAATNLPVVAEQPVSTPPTPSPKPQGSRFFDINTDTKTSTLDPLRTFDNNPKYETALAVARDFYGKNNFVDAAIWAKKANQMNREGEEAWMLYAKSYYAQGRKKEAIGVLELYLNFKDSKAALELLRTWKQTP